MHLIQLFLFSSIIYMVKNDNDYYNTSTLKLVHVVVRHANRTVDRGSRYPMDPYINETYHPFGYGALTNKGKLKAYNVGVALRKRFNQFLGEEYIPGILDASSTNFSRTKLSLEYLLDGLYRYEFSTNHSNSRGIPYNCLSITNHLLPSLFNHCEKFNKLYSEFLESSTGSSILSLHSPLFQYLSQNTGLNITETRYTLILTTTLEAQNDWGYKLPSWTDSVWPDILNRASGQEYAISTFTPELAQLSGGFLLKKIIEDTEAKLNNQQNSSLTKMFIYSGHDSNIGFLLGALKVLIPHDPPYSAYLLIEVHTIDEVDGIKIFYEDYKQDLMKQLVVPGCSSFCSFSRFVELLKCNIPAGKSPCEIET